ncbi:hypothetical protein EN802_13720 [bacterium M00.F.Ca.ET.159.01.1.1]|nr:hypothetical protein EN802_13720 [bacterium M00.F.Ca.ET.159.01.1.1]
MRLVDPSPMDQGRPLGTRRRRHRALPCHAGGRRRHMKRLIPYAGKDPGERDPVGARHFRRQDCEEKIPHRGRHGAILRRHDAGESHVAIAADYGISRERVRQIIKAAGGKPRRGKP